LNHETLITPRPPGRNITVAMHAQHHHPSLGDRTHDLTHDDDGCRTWANERARPPRMTIKIAVAELLMARASGLTKPVRLAMILPVPRRRRR
jgi:hypothetical protein